MAETYTQQLEFTVDGQADDAFTVFRMTGREAISELFRFEVDVVSDDSHLALDTLAGKDASLTITRLERTRRIHGMLERIEQHGATPQGQFVYRAILVPRLQRLTYSRQNQIHGTATAVSVRDVLEHELTAKDLKGAQASAVSGRLGLDDFELRLTQTYPQRDYIVQYDESDFAFISRLCEHYGIFYFFSHETGRDVVVFGDSRVAFPQSTDSDGVAYRTASGLASADQAAVYRFVSRVAMVPAHICLRDYNYRLPNLTLEVDETVDPNGHGVVIDYGSHFRTPQEGRDLARVRAQELLGRKTVFEGTSDSVDLAAGSVFDLTDHFRSDYNAGYLVTWIEHEATQSVPGIAEFVGAGHQTGYLNRFECLPKSVEFRPARVTPKPKMAGLSNATVDGSGSGQRAELDASGRYKIRQQFDQRGEAAGQASRYMRKAEPYGGANTGMHFPLLKGTEVVLACVNGDPDRPIIVGAMQNEQYPSIVNSRCNTTNRLQTTSGSLFEIDDGPAGGGGSGGGGSGGGGGAALAPQRALEGAAPAPTSAPAPIAEMPAAEPPGQPLAAQRGEAEIRTTGSASASYARLQITSGTESYWRIGAQPTDTKESDKTPDMSDMSSDAGGAGLFEYTAGDSTSLVTGSSYRQVDTNSYDYVKGTRRTSAATHDAVSTGQYRVIAKGVSIQASTGTITDASSASTAPDGNVEITTSNDFKVNVSGDSNVTMDGSSFFWFKGTDTQYKSGSTYSIFAGSESSLNLGMSSKTYVGYRSRFWLVYNSNFGIGIDSKWNIGSSTAAYIGSRNVLVGGAKIKAYYAEMAANAAAKIEAGVSKLATNIAECYSASTTADIIGIEAAMGMYAHM